jgi:valyl-tRNA synthetase
LEAIKPEFLDGKALPIDTNTYESTLTFLENLLCLMHPWMPFITEEIWHIIKERGEKDCIIVAAWPAAFKTDGLLLEKFEKVKELVTTIRNIRAQKQMSPKEKLSLFCKSGEELAIFRDIVIKLSNLTSFDFSGNMSESGISFLIGQSDYLIPLSENINIEEERERIMKEIEYNKGFLKSVQGKLANEKFVSNAKPELVALERKKESDAISKIKSLEEQLSVLG